MGFKLRTDGRELPDIPACLGYLRAVLRNIWVRQDFGENVCAVLQVATKVEQTKRRSWARAYGFGNRIEMPTRNWAWNRYVLLHELAHIITYHLFRAGNYNRVAPHGPEFCWVFLRLLKHVGDPNGHALMKRLFDLNGVRYWKDSPLKKAADHQ